VGVGVGADKLSGETGGDGAGDEEVGCSESFFTTVVYLRISCDKDDFIWTIDYKQYKTQQIDFNLTGIQLLYNKNITNIFMFSIL
jgi:hypothetical protein